MWIAKGTFLGVWLISVGTIALLYFALYRKLPPNSLVDVRNFPKLTIYNPFWWLAVFSCFVVGLSAIREWSFNSIVWIVLAVTELAPVGLVSLFFVTVSKLKQAADSKPDTPATLCARKVVQSLE